MDLSQIPIQEFAQTMIVTCPHGIHLRVAADIAKLMSGYESKVKIHFQKLEVDAKSVLNLMELGAAKGETVRVVAKGNDAEAAVDAISQYFKSNQKCDETARNANSLP